MVRPLERGEVRKCVNCRRLVGYYYAQTKKVWTHYALDANKACDQPAVAEKTTSDHVDSRAWQ